MANQWNGLLNCTGPVVILVLYFSALNSKSLCAAVFLSAHELLRCREEEDKQLFIQLILE